MQTITDAVWVQQNPNQGNKSKNSIKDTKVETVDRKHLRCTSWCFSAASSVSSACNSILETLECSFLTCRPKPLNKWLCGALSETLNSACSFTASWSSSSPWPWFFDAVPVPDDVLTLLTVPRIKKLEKRRTNIAAGILTEWSILSLQIDNCYPTVSISSSIQKPCILKQIKCKTCIQHCACLSKLRTKNMRRLQSKVLLHSSIPKLHYTKKSPHEFRTLSKSPNQIKGLHLKTEAKHSFSDS